MTVDTAPTDATRDSGLAILARGFALAPAIRDGLGLTMLLAAISTIGSSIVPIVVQRIIDDGLGAGRAPKLSAIASELGIALTLILLTAAAAYWMRVRLFVASETGLSDLRVRAFSHVHDLSTLTQNAQRRGVLVARVTSDVDQISAFLQFVGIMMVISVGQILVASIVMLYYSWQLTLVVWVCFIPLMASLKYFANRLSRAYDRVRSTVGTMLAAIGEPVVGASVVRAHAIEDRTQRRVDAGINANLDANTKAQKLVSVTFASAGLAGGLANAAVLVAGVALGVSGQLSLGSVIAFAFLVNLIVGPVQNATQVLTEAQNAIASWRRVIDLIDTEADIVDPADSGERIDTAHIEIEFNRVQYHYPDGPKVLTDVTVRIEPGQRVAVVGETGSGKTTFAKLLTRLLDPSSGVVRLAGHSAAAISFQQLRQHVLMVPQEGFLFDATLRDNLRYGRSDATDQQLLQGIDDLALTDWFSSLPGGLDTPVGQRGESLSAGERQLVALVRSALADPDVIVLDEATSAVDPQTELRAIQALDRLLAGRTSVTIAHRLTTAENADRVLVFDLGRLVQDGTHAELVNQPGVYRRLYASWRAQAALGR